MASSSSFLDFLNLLGLLVGLLKVSCGFLGSGLSLTSHIEIELGVLGTNWLDELLLEEILDEGSGNRTTNLELLAKYGSGDTEDLWDLLNHSLVSLLLKEDGVVKLFLDLGLGPGLLLGFSTLSFGRTTLGSLSILGRAFTCILTTYLCFLSL
jgi:hypothetical protein